MTQYARPDSDSTIGNWTDNADGVASIYTTIDEASASDADYVQSEASPSASAYICTLSDITDPVSSSSHVVSYRYKKDVDAGTVNLTVGLFQATTEIHTETHNNIAATWTAGAFTLSSGEADTITDYTDLRLKFTATQA